MFGLTDKLMSGAFGVGCLVLAGLLLVQTGALHKAERRVDKAEVALSAEKQGREEDRRLTAEAALTAAKVTLRTQELITTKYQGAINAAIQQADVSRRDAAAARSESDGLREQALFAARRLADAATPPAAVTEYAVTVNELFDNCQRDYQSMAEKAAGHAADVRTILAAWPVTKPPEIQRMPQQGVGAGSS